MLGQAGALSGQPLQTPAQATRLQRRLIKLHSGDFLRGDSEPACIVRYRERLQGRLLNRFDQLGRYWERHGHWRHAVTIYQQMLEISEQRETAYQRLMACYHALGLTAEAIATYEQCRKALFHHHGIAPSAETEAIYQRLRKPI